jgi:anti-anti-sigma factor
VSDRPRLDISRADGGTVARLDGCPRLTEEDAGWLAGQLAGLVGSRPGEHLLLDLAGVEYLTSMALGEFVGLHNRLRAGGGRLSLLNVRPMVYEVLAAMRLDRLLDARPAGEPPPPGAGPPPGA